MVMTDSTFSLLLLICVAFCGFVTFLDIFWLKNRKKQNKALVHKTRLKKRLNLIEYLRSIFPILLIVLIIRSFFYAPFYIPSGSMLPTLNIGDYILVNKFDYGLRLPYLGTKVFSIGHPKRGDIVVFSSTSEFSQQNNGKKEDLIKRLVGLPGDHIRYQNKRLYINDQPVNKHFETEKPGHYSADLNGAYPYLIYHQTLGHHYFQIQNYPIINSPSGHWVTPEKMYFVMGDNRDLSDDSRYWGFVPEEHIIGKAVLIWMHWPSWKNVPKFSANRILH